MPALLRRAAKNSHFQHPECGIGHFSISITAVEGKLEIKTRMCQEGLEVFVPCVDGKMKLISP